MFFGGIVGLALLSMCEWWYDRYQRKRALVLRDSLIPSPRCEQKAKELGIRTGVDWKPYFAQDDTIVDED
ncbi:hypothetical protein AAVH_05643 [Aphelenchoides avenae]|nr:hypothetical protein AAVH_05643 [Aphelenchus avenae]